VFNMNTYRAQRLEWMQDLVFDGDGEVRLPKAAALAIGIALRSTGVLSNQPTEERAVAVADAVRPLVAKQGARTEVRKGRNGERWLVCAVPARTPAKDHAVPAS
jgi:hypothetical protein